MGFSDVLRMLGGLALFLHGMKMMGDGLEAVAGNKLKRILEKLTTNPYMGVLVGIVLTAAVQSSSATTVMTLGFVNSGMMQLSQAVGVIMGANIGTTITGQMIALDIGIIAPIFAICGIAIIMFIKNRRTVNTGEIIAGLGILFIGMGLMSEGMKPLRDMPMFINAMTNFRNPLLGILAGALFTALIQSSSASIGILQTLVITGVMVFDNSVYILFGMNIGTCITAGLASIGANRNAKRVTLMHIMFNVIGTVIFTIVCMKTPLTEWIASWTPARPAAQIANVHTFFNLTTTVLLFPLRKIFADLSVRILPERESEDNLLSLKFISEQKFGSTSISITNLCKEIKIMMKLARVNADLSLASIIEKDDKNKDEIAQNEEYIDYLNMEITRYMANITGMEMPTEDARKVNTLFRVTGDLERIGDHAENISEYLGALMDKSIEFSASATAELLNLRELIDESLNIIYDWHYSEKQNHLDRVMEIEDCIDEYTLQYRANQVERMADKSCMVEGGVIYSELLTDIERMSDHILNIAQAFSLIDMDLSEI